jgi:hypothetical protein
MIDGVTGFPRSGREEGTRKEGKKEDKKWNVFRNLWRYRKYVAVPLKRSVLY